jgi:hypothetical protein
MRWSRSSHPDARSVFGTLALALAACESILGADFDHTSDEPTIVISGGGTGATLGDGSIGGSGGVFTNGCSTQISDDCPSGPCFQGSCLVPKALGLGAEHSCALLDDASVWCWGSNRTGQLGRAENAGSDQANAAAPVTGLANIVTLAVGGWFSCAVSGEGKAYCWGLNAHGELGRGAASAYEWEPAQLQLSNVNAVFASKGGDPEFSLGGHACARVDNEMYCWGSNEFGELGQSDSTEFVAAPQRAPELDGSTVVALGFNDTCRVKTDLGCRGYHRFGLEADGFHSDFLKIVGPVVSIAIGNAFACWANYPASLQSIGDNSVGQLCDSTNQSAATSVQSLLVGPVVEAGNAIICTLGLDDVVRCCGSNKSLALGSPSLDYSSVPVVVVGHVLELAVGWSHSCVIVADDSATSTHGGIRCWGANGLGQLGWGAADSAELQSVTWIGVD